MHYCRFFVILVALLASAPLFAHEVRPAALEISQDKEDILSIEWKLPITDGKKLKLFPILPDQCKLPDDSEQKIIGTVIVESWKSQCALDSGTIRIDGLDRTLTDVFVRIKKADQDEKIFILRPTNPVLNLAGAQGAGLSEYLGIGVEHMIFGWDHLLFVLALLLIVTRRQILWVITAFTVGHSITLGITALGLLSLPSGPIELLIALSIFFLAIEAMRKNSGKSSITIRYPWVVSAAFGLLHGLGFAGALAEIGLPSGQELWALALFNIGIELGQIIFIIATALLLMLIRRISWLNEDIIKLTLIYAVGALGAYYTFTRIF